MASRRAPLRRIGLTGGIGSGKSVVAAALARLGAEVVDSDAISRAATAASGTAIPALRAHFGDDYIDADGALDRDRMRQRAFSDPQARRQLEAIVHPLVGEEIRRRTAAAGDAVVVYDVPLLVESGRWRSMVERVIVVDCHEATQVRRVMARSGWTADTVERVIANQASRAQRRAAADAVLWNEDLSLAALDAEVQALWDRWCRER